MTQTDELELVRRLRPAVDGDLAALAQARQRLHHAMSARSSGRVRRRWQPRSFGVGVAAAVVVVLGGTAAAVVSSSGPARNSATVACTAAADESVEAVMPASSGDPLADCQAWWRSTRHTEPPALQAVYRTGIVLVMPASSPRRTGDEPLPAGFTQLAAILQLDHELGELTRGLDSGNCRTLPEATAIVHRQLDRLGLFSWTVHTAAQNPRPACASYALDGGRALVEVIDVTRVESRPTSATAATPSPDGAPMTDEAALRAFDSLLASATISGPGAHCTSAAAVTALVSSSRREAGLASGEVVVQPSYRSSAVPDGTTTCVRPALDVAGAAVLHLDAVGRLPSLPPGS